MKKKLSLLMVIYLSAIVANAQHWTETILHDHYTLSIDNLLLPAGNRTPGEIVWNWESVLCYDDQNALSYRYTQTFDTQGRVLEQQVEKRTEATWGNYIKITFAWLNGTLISGTTAMWTGSAWQDVIRIKQTTDGQHRVTMEVIEKYSAGNWVNDARRNYSYTFGDKKLQVLQENWKNNAWINDYKNDYAYDNNGFLKTITNQFSDNGGPWENGMRLNYTCNAQGYWLEMTMDSYETGSWQPVGKVTYANDAEGNIITELFASKVGNSWVNEMKMSYTCVEGNTLTGKNETLSGVTWIPLETTSYIYKNHEYLLLMTDPVYRWEASYIGFIVGMEETGADDFITVYPNPANDVITITGLEESGEISDVQWYESNGNRINANGTLHIGITGTPRYLMNTQGLANGIHLLKIRTNRGVMTKKVIIQH